MLQTLLPLLQVPGGAELVIIGIVLVVFLLVGAVWVGISYWVYKDATKRNMDNAAIWAIATFAIGIFGLILYVIVRE